MLFTITLSPSFKAASSKKVHFENIYIFKTNIQNLNSLSTFKWHSDKWLLHFKVCYLTHTRYFQCKNRYLFVLSENIKIISLFVEIYSRVGMAKSITVWVI